MARKNTKAKIPPPPGTKASAKTLAAYFEKYGLEELEAAGYVRNLSAQEKKEMDKLAAENRAWVIERKRERTQLNLAMSPDELERLIRYANKKHIPPSTLAKAWILQRLDEETEKA